MSHDAHNPEISIILSTFNRAGLLPRAIDSVRAQSFESFELIVINDASTDDTGSALEHYAHDPRLRIISNEHNLGLQRSLNRGIEAARGTYIARIDDDDCWTDAQKLDKQVARLNQNPNCGLVGTAYVDEQGETCLNPLTDGDIRRQILFRCPFCHSSVLMRAEAVRGAGGYDDSLPYAEDWDLWLKIGVDWELANLGEVCVTRDRGSETLSEQYFLRQLDIARQLVRRHGADYPARIRARAYHAASVLFFTVIPVGGRIHRMMQSLFTRVFGLRANNAG